MGTHRGHAFWSKIVAEYRQVAAQESQRSFAERRGVSSKTLGYWLKKLEGEDLPEVGLVPMVLRPRASETVPGVRIRLGDPPVLELMDPVALPPNARAHNTRIRSARTIAPYGSSRCGVLGPLRWITAPATRSRWPATTASVSHLKPTP